MLLLAIKEARVNFVTERERVTKGKGDGSGGLKRNIGGGSFKKLDSFFTKKPRLQIAHSRNLPTTTTDNNSCNAEASASTAILPTLTLDEEKIALLLSTIFSLYYMHRILILISFVR
ncbi:unnamed protein product, partial [Iphiclides podalirius]